MTTWHTRGFKLAELVASWSKDPSTKVGAAIIRPDKTIASVGYNGFPRGVNDDPDKYADRPTKYMRTVHAEVNAILSAHSSVRGCTLYVTPLHPCSNCAAIIIQAGIKEVHFRVDANNPRNDAWKEHSEHMAQMFNEASVSFKQWDR